MNRRSFFTNWITRPDSHYGSGTPQPSRPLSSGLEPFVPDALHPWDALRAGHLLRRCTMLPRWADINALLALSPAQAVDLLLNTPSVLTRPNMADNATESLDGLDITLQEQVKGTWRADCEQLRSWLALALAGANLTIVEKMTFFWSGHFTSEFETEDTFVVGPLLYRQNTLIRDQCLSNLRNLTFALTLDAGMLVYLGGDLSNGGAPNENYSRELLELFTAGLGQYTEGDVQNGARILTGWRAARFVDKPARNGMFNTYFDPASHDINAKEYLGVSFPARDVSTNTEFIVKQEEVKKLVDTIFDKRANAVAKFISRKIYRFFVYSSPSGSDEAVITAMADLLIQNNFEIKPVMGALLKSAHFFDNANIGAQIKTPAEFEIGLARQLGAGSDIAGTMARLDQTLFEPPNVSGWPGYREWITTTTYPLRSDIAHAAVQGMDDNAVIAFMKTLPDYADAAKLVRNTAALLLPRPLSTDRFTLLEAKLLGAAPDYEWPDIVSSSPSTAARNMRDMLTTMVDLPDFQLC